jgi:hypothetical protein
MHPIFYGFGPIFRRKNLADPFRSVDMYPLMSYILHLEERITNGSLDKAKHILKNFNEENFLDELNSFISIIETNVSEWGIISKFICKKSQIFLLICLAVGCVILVILTAIVYTIVACRYSRQLIFVERHYAPVRYRLLSVNEGSTNNFVGSESENEDVTT